MSPGARRGAARRRCRVGERVDDVPDAGVADGVRAGLHAAAASRGPCCVVGSVQPERFGALTVAVGLVEPAVPPSTVPSMKNFTAPTRHRRPWRRCSPMRSPGSVPGMHHGASRSRSGSPGRSRCWRAGRGRRRARPSRARRSGRWRPSRRAAPAPARAGRPAASRHDRVDQVHRGVLDEMTCRAADLVAGDMRALRELARPVDACQRQRGAAGQGRVPVVEAQERRNPGQRVVDGRAGDGLPREHVVIKPEAAHPVAAPGLVAAAASRARRSATSRQPDRSSPLNCSTPSSGWVCPSTSPGVIVAPARSMTSVPGPRSATASSSSARSPRQRPRPRWRSDGPGRACGRSPRP